MKVSLRLKVVAIFIIIEFLTIIAIGFLYSRKGTKLLEQEFFEKNEAFTQLFASTVTLPLLAGNKELLQRECNKMLKKQDIIKIEIIEANSHNILQCLSNEKKDKSFEDSQIIKYPVKITQDKNYLDYENIYDINPDTKLEIIGFVKIAYSRQAINQKIRELRYFTFLICLAALLSSIILGILIVDRIIVNPILKLKKGVQAFSSGKLNQKINIHTEDEISELASSFNHMAQSLKNYIYEQIEQATDKVQLKNLAMLGELSTMLLHEVRNTINKFGVIRHQLSKENLSNEGQLALEALNENLKSLKRFTQNISLFSKKPKVSLKKVNLNELIKTLCSSLKLINTKGVQIITSIPATPCHIMGDKELINQAVLNILTNAIDAVRHGGVVSVKLKSSESHILITITDNGIGIPKDELDKIFQPFFTKKGPKGTGLGLAIAKSFIEAHKGSIKVNSRRGRTEFTIKIPTHLP